MATKCPLCRHEFSFAEILRRWNPFGTPCPHCRKPLSVKTGMLLAILFVSLVVPLCWFFRPMSNACGETALGLEALLLEGFQIFAVVLGLAVLADWICWKTGWPGYIPARSADGKATRFWRLFLVVGLPLGLAVAPTGMLFHWSGVFGKTAEQRLESMPVRIKEMKERKLTLEESRKLILINLDRIQTGLESEVLICRALRIQSGLVLMAMAWFLFWSCRMIFYPPASQIPNRVKKRSNGTKKSENRPKKQNL